LAVCFLSYSRTPLDIAALTSVRSVLESANQTYWFDEYLKSNTGTELNAEIADQIINAEAVVIFASSQYVSSRYCQAEAAFAIEKDKNIVRIDVEPYKLPPALLPLAAFKSLLWSETQQNTFVYNLAMALAEKGIDISQGTQQTLQVNYNPLDHAAASLVRPNYLRLKSGASDYLRDVERRLMEAASHNPSNGYNQLSLAFLWVYKHDAVRALSFAQQAVTLLALQPDAHYAEALALCALNPPKRRSKDETEEILRRLAIARRLPRSGAHVDLLSAIVIANYYLPRYLTPPANPEQLLSRGLSQASRFDPNEIARVLDHEAILYEELLPGLSAYRT
jgi:hypothetical protein